jgi:hypothetical protein
LGGDKRGNRRGKMSSFPDPLELDKVDKTWEDDEPSVFDRVTAVPGEMPDTPPDGSGGGEDPISGLYQRQTPEQGLPSFREPLPDDELPPVLGPTPPSRKSAPKGAKPVDSKPNDSWRNTGTRRTRPAKRPVLELELDDIESKAPPPPRAQKDALEARCCRAAAAEPLPVRGRSSAPELPRHADRYATGDSHRRARSRRVVARDAPDHEEARRCHERCTEVLSQMYLARLGSSAQAVRVSVPNDQIKWLSLDHRAGFLLSLVDGHLTIEELLDISGMPRLDALRILYGLLDQRVIALS